MTRQSRGVLLIFTMMTGPPAAPWSLTDRRSRCPVPIAIALITV